MCKVQSCVIWKKLIDYRLVYILVHCQYYFISIFGRIIFAIMRFMWVVCCDSRLCFRYDALTFYHLAIRYEMSSDKESTLVSMLEAAVMNRLKLFRASFFFLIYIYIILVLNFINIKNLWLSGINPLMNGLISILNSQNSTNCWMLDWYKKELRISWIKSQFQIYLNKKFYDCKRPELANRPWLPRIHQLLDIGLVQEVRQIRLHI